MKSYEEIASLKARLEKENVYLQEEIRNEHNFEEIVGNSPALLSLLRRVDQVAPTDSSVLIYGETGTGKELIARAIHDRSARKKRPLVKVNCSAISAGLVESELFGHVKGAFTGAFERRIGRFELADGGTLFLEDRKSTRLNSSHVETSYAVFCLKKKTPWSTHPGTTIPTNGDYRPPPYTCCAATRRGTHL